MIGSQVIMHATYNFQHPIIIGGQLLTFQMEWTVTFFGTRPLTSAPTRTFLDLLSTLYRPLLSHPKVKLGFLLTAPPESDFKMLIANPFIFSTSITHLIKAARLLNIYTR